jgi:hypothetical protein
MSEVQNVFGTSWTPRVGTDKLPHLRQTTTIRIDPLNESLIANKYLGSFSVWNRAAGKSVNAETETFW